MSPFDTKKQKKRGQVMVNDRKEIGIDDELLSDYVMCGVNELPM
ncbi:MAG: hypothetical protein ACSLEL_05415 [Candidatus Malihini olakiniferum]